MFLPQSQLSIALKSTRCTLTTNTFLLLYHHHRDSSSEYVRLHLLPSVQSRQQIPLRWLTLFYFCIVLTILISCSTHVIMSFGSKCTLNTTGAASTNIFLYSIWRFVSYSGYVALIKSLSVNTKTELHQLARLFLLWHLHCRTSCSSMLHWTHPKCILGILNKTRRISPTNAFSFILSLSQLSTASKLMGCAALTNTKTFTFCNISVVTASKLIAIAC